MIQGQCLCGEIQFEASEILGMVFNCHCSRCRKAHGAAFATQVIGMKDSLKFISGQERLKEFVVGNIVRAFCGNCGSRLMNYTVGPEYLSIALTAIKDNEKFVPMGECFISEKLPFVQLNGAIAHYQQLP